MAKKLMAERYRGDENLRGLCLPADEIERDDSLIFAWKNENGKRRLVAVVSIGSYDAIYLTETQTPPAVMGGKL